MLSAPHIVGKGRTFVDKDPTGKLIDPHSEVLFKSHAKKIEKMKDWNDSSFKRMKVEEKLGAFTLRVLATKVNCSSCGVGHANKSCKMTLCKKCCLDDEPIKKCAAHSKKPTVGSN
jgi:hypothetical protein